MRLLGLGMVLVLALSAQAQDFNSSRRFDKSADSVVEMGHDRWVEFFCSDARAGKEGRVEAERVYCLALHELNTKSLKTLPPSERTFYSDAFSYFADLAKTSFGIGLERSENKDAWALPIAESSTAINETLWRMLNPNRKKAFITQTLNIDNLADRIEAMTTGQDNQLASDSRRYRSIAKKIELHFANRPALERYGAKLFAVKMGHMALLRL